MVLRGTEQYLCMECLQVVTNPICYSCFSKHISSWLEYEGAQSYIQARVFREINKIIRKESLNKDQCILCNNNFINMCSFCFYSKVERIMEKLDIPSQVIGDFEDLFIDKSYKIQDEIIMEQRTFSIEINESYLDEEDSEDK